MPRQRINAIGGIGFSTDLNPVDIPLQGLTSMRNVKCEDKKLVCVDGEKAALSETIFGLPQPMTEHFTYKDTDGKWWAVWHVGQHIYAGILDGGEDYDAILSGLTTSCYVTFADLNGILIVNSNKDGLYYCPGLDGGGFLDTLVVAPGWGANWTCDFIAAYRYNIVACGMTENGNYYPHKIRWSSSAAEGALPIFWIAALTNDAGADLIGDTPGYPVTAITVRDSLWIVKDDCIYSMQWIGGQFVMQLNKLHGSIGTTIKKGVVEFKGGCIIFDGQDLVYFDGQNTSSLIDDRLRTEITNNISYPYLEYSELFNYKQESELYLAIPTGNQTYCQKAYILNYTDNTWGSYDTPILYGFGLANVDEPGDLGTWSTITDGWDDKSSVIWAEGISAAPVTDLVTFKAQIDPLTGTDRGIAVFNTIDTFYDSFWSRGEPIVCEVIRTGIPFNDTTGFAVITEVWPEVTKGDIKLWFGAHNNIEGQPDTWDGPYTISENDYNPITPLVTGKYFAWKLENTYEITNPGPVSYAAIPGSRFEFAGMTINWEPDGEF